MQTIGERLEEARKKKGISIREAAEATKIRGEYLQKFESNQFDIGLTEIYTRGFLRGYASYLKLPADRILSDYSAVRGGEPRSRQPSREVYGRMDLGISSSDDRTELETDTVAEPAPRPQQARFQRPGDNLPKGPAIDAATMYKLGKVAVLVVGLLIAVWIVTEIASSVKPVPSPAPARASTPAPSEAVESVAAAPTVTVVALDTVRIKVVRKSDGSELFQGSLQKGERREYPNIPLFLTASELSSVAIEYKGKTYSTGHAGHDRVQFDFSTR